MKERDLKIKEPVYPPEVSSEAAAEARAAWGLGIPWSRIRPLREGERYPNVACSGFRRETCTKEPQAVQLCSFDGSPLLYCEEHALLQNEQDNIHYYSKPVEPEKLSQETEEFIAFLLKKGPKRRKREDVSIPADDFETF